MPVIRCFWELWKVDFNPEQPFKRMDCLPSWPSFEYFLFCIFNLARASILGALGHLLRPSEQTSFFQCTQAFPFLLTDERSLKPCSPIIQVTVRRGGALPETQLGKAWLGLAASPDLACRSSPLCRAQDRSCEPSRKQKTGSKPPIWLGGSDTKVLLHNLSPEVCAARKLLTSGSAF